MQGGRNERQAAVHDQGLDHHCAQDHPGPRRACDRGIVAQYRPQTGVAGGHRRRGSQAGGRTGAHQDGDDAKECSQHDEGPSPADSVDADPADQLSADHPDQAAAHHAGQHRVPRLIGHLIADPGKGDRNDGAPHATRHHACGHQPMQTGRQCAGNRGKRRQHHRGGDDSKLAQPITERTDAKLQQSVADRKAGIDAGHSRQAGLKVVGKARQHRIADPHGRAAGKAAEREQTNDACHDTLIECVAHACKARFWRWMEAARAGSRVMAGR